jgi:hypothetical protein
MTVQNRTPANAFMDAKYLPGFASWTLLRVESGVKMVLDRTRDFSPIFSDWIGTPVLLYVFRQCRVPIPCYIIGESASTVHIRLDPGSNMQVPKELIIAIEEAAAIPNTCSN